MKSFDVVIAGGGIIGASCALELARRGAHVALLDRQPAGREASWAAAGLLSPVPESPSAIPLVPLAKASLALYPEFVAHVENSTGRRTGFRPFGSIEALFAENARTEQSTLVALHHGLGFPTEVLAIEEALRLEPSLNPEARAAALLRFEASVDNRALTQTVFEAARHAGVHIREDAEVTGILHEGRRAAGVITGQEQIRARFTVIAAGCYSAQLAGVEAFAPVRPVRGQMVAFRSRHVRIERSLRSERGYLVPRDDGRILAGSTVEDAGFDKNVTAEGIAGLLRMAVELVPRLADAAIVETWAGLRPGTPDQLPILGPTETDGLLIATGHYRNGILLAPVTARLITSWVLGEKITEDVERFSPARFAPHRRAAKIAE